MGPLKVVVAILGVVLLTACRGSGVSEGIVKTPGWDPMMALPSPTDDSLVLVAMSTKVAAPTPALVRAPAEELFGQPSIVQAVGWTTDAEVVFTFSDALGGAKPDRLGIINPMSGDTREVPLGIAVTSSREVAAVDPTGTYVVVSAMAPSEYDLDHDLWRIDLETGDAVNLTNTPEVSEGEPVFIDDRRLVILAGVQVGVVDLDRGEMRVLTPENQTVISVDVDPTGRWVVYSGYPENRRDESKIWMVAIDGTSSPTVLLDNPGVEPRLSSDGHHILVRQYGPFLQAGTLEWLSTPDSAPWLTGN